MKLSEHAANRALAQQATKRAAYVAAQHCKGDLQRKVGADPYNDARGVK